MISGSWGTLSLHEVYLGGMKSWRRCLWGVCNRIMCLIHTGLKGLCLIYLGIFLDIYIYNDYLFYSDTWVGVF